MAGLSGLLGAGGSVHTTNITAELPASPIDCTVAGACGGEEIYDPKMNQREFMLKALQSEDKLKPRDVLAFW
eukprot:COSAG01_NODE_4149_length_5293_cov_71.856180_8_plen_71_part_01